MQRVFQLVKGDKVIWIVVTLLSIFSILAVYSSTGTLAYKVQGGNTMHFIGKHFSLLLFGFLLMYVTHRVRYTLFSTISVGIMLVSIPLLFLTLLMGTNLNDASRWITVPILNLSFQSSDLAKLALIMYVSRVLAKKQDQIKDFKAAFIPVLAPILIICGLILPANFSTAAVLFLTCIFLMFIGRINFKYIAALIGSGVVVFVLFVSVALLIGKKGRIETWQHRIENFANGGGDANYQSIQGKIAISTGGLIGKGPGNSSQRNFLPHPYSDFIYAIICEEYGLWGACLVVILYLTLFYRTTLMVRKSHMAFASLLAVGCTFSLVFQAMINMAVAVNIMPVTGQPLPLLSMGGTSIWFTSISIGIVLSVSRGIEEDKGGVYAAA